MLQAQGAPEQGVQIGQARPPGEDVYSVTVARRDVASGRSAAPGQAGLTAECQSAVVQFSSYPRILQGTALGSLSSSLP